MMGKKLTSKITLGLWFACAMDLVHAGTALWTFEVDSQNHSPCQAGNTCYNDWFLPAGNNATVTGQLNCLYDHRGEIGGFSNDFYWSSTEHDADDAWIESFFSGFEGNANKGFSVGFRVRCVRAFTP